MAEELLEEENFAAMFEASEKAQETTNRIVEGEIGIARRRQPRFGWCW